MVVDGFGGRRLPWLWLATDWIPPRERRNHSLLMNRIDTKKYFFMTHHETVKKDEKYGGTLLADLSVLMFRSPRSNPWSTFFRF
jgi:hypothetical protein